ncbi:hypothetical protein GE061_004991 [Apolygus lucorum]|uniref:Epoxide hydrolase N-terminal domain-containing protein n=1 Tax=Apolygus lucorum TaxID=248454 RepID=A0A8S9WWQ5_APOLU|nr:hypothetical protein GE061_004991 [Apolygus lucorum]
MVDVMHTGTPTSKVARGEVNPTHENFLSYNQRSKIILLIPHHSVKLFNMMKAGQVNLCLAILGPIVLVGVVSIGVLWSRITAIPETPIVPLGYWGPGSFKPDDLQIVPFSVNVSQEDLDDLWRRLDNTRKLTEPSEGTGFTYGFNTTYLNTIIRYWRDEYNWSERQALLNEFPQFRTRIGGINIHFVHIKPDLDKLKGKLSKYNR